MFFQIPNFIANGLAQPNHYINYANAAAAVTATAQVAYDLGSQAAKTYVQYYLTSWMISNTMSDLTLIDPKRAEDNAKAIGGFIKIISEHSTEAFTDSNEIIASSSLRTWVPVVITMGLATTALPLVYQYVQKVLMNNIGKPPLCLKQHKITYFSMLKDKLNELNPYAKPPEEITKPIFKKEVEDKIQEIVEATNNIQRNDAFFQNVILYGPGGTGKTMIAEKIAKEAGMNYMMMSGGELGQFIKRGEHVAELNKLLNSAERSSVPTIIFIDESEGLCKKRADLDQERLELQNTLLNRTGTPSKKIMIILATNRITDIDKAILNRMAHKVLIDVPGLEERVQIIDLYAKQFFKDDAERNEFFGPEAIQTIARKTENLSGRSLFYIINSIFTKKCTTADNRLTEGIVDRAVDDYVLQEKVLREQEVALK